MESVTGIENKKSSYKDKKKQIKEEQELTHLSKTMSYLLRHNAHEHGLNIESSGFVKLEDLLNCKPMKKHHATFEKVAKVVENDKKGRYELVNRPPYYIRAVQGHSIKTVKDEDILDTIKNIFEYPVVVHGTYFDAWDKIQNTGLNRMTRNCIHFSIGHKKEDHVISGMRNNCEVFIEANSVQAFYNGVDFFVSKNKVILSPGIEGVIPPKYFKKVVDLHGNVLYSQKYEIGVVFDFSDPNCVSINVVDLLDKTILFSTNFSKVSELNDFADKFINEKYILRPFVVITNDEEKYTKMIQKEQNEIKHLTFYLDYIPVTLNDMPTGVEFTKYILETFIQKESLTSSLNKRINLDLKKHFDKQMPKDEEEVLENKSNTDNNLSGSTNVVSNYTVTKKVLANKSISKNYILIFLNFEEEDILKSIDYIIIPDGNLDNFQAFNFKLQAIQIKKNLISFLDELKGNLTSAHVVNKMLILCITRDEFDYLNNLMKKNMINKPKLFQKNVIKLNTNDFNYLEQGEYKQAAEIFLLQYVLDETAIEKIKFLL